MSKRLGERFVRILNLHVLADDGNAHLAFRILHAVDHALPAREIGFGRIFDAEDFQDLCVEALGVIGKRRLVNRRQIGRGDHTLRAHIAEESNFSPFIVGNRHAGAAQQYVGLDADRTQLLHRMLRRLRFQLAGGFDEGYKRQVYKSSAFAAEIVAELADGFKEWQALDIAHRAADFDQQEIDLIGARHDETLDGVGDVRDDLNGAAEIAAAALRRDHFLIDAAGGDVVGFAGRNGGEPLVMAEIEIGFGAVVRHIDLAVLKRAHGPGIDVQIGIEFSQAHAITARLEKRTECRRSQPLAE